ncbi:MAG TPA: hypothetical protein VGE24_11245 [Emticicia sp.]
MANFSEKWGLIFGYKDCQKMYQYLGKPFATDKWSDIMDKWMKKKTFEQPLEKFFDYF